MAWLFPPQPKLDAVRASVLSRERYERLVVAERPWWERVLAPVASRIAARMPALASQISERDIVRAGIDPATLTPAEVYAAKLVLAIAILGIGLALTPVFGFALILALPLAFVGYIFPTEYLGSLGKRRKAQLSRELPDFLALVRPLAERKGLEQAIAAVADELHAASNGENLLARQIRSAVAAYGTGTEFYRALADVAAASDVEELDELASRPWLRLAEPERVSPTSSPSTSAHSGRPSATACSARPRPSSRSSPRSWPASTCRCSSSSLSCPSSCRRWGGSEWRPKRC